MRHRAMYQRRSAEDAERLLYQFAEADPDVLWMFSPDWSELLFCNEAYEEVWGRSLADLVDEPLDFLDGVHPNDRERVRDAMATLSDETPVEMEYRVIPAGESDQREVWLEGEPVYDEDGAFVGIAGYVRDVTERTRYERRLERTNGRLEAFNSFLSHDLRNQLQIATGELQLARDERSGERLDEHLDEIERSLDRMAEMTSEILALPRLDFDSLDRAAVSLRELAERSFDAVESDRATLVVAADATLHVDEALVRNALENLFRNAVEHNDAPVTIRVGPLPDAVGFYVEDDGEGIPFDERDRVFEFGYSTGDGGIGLAFVREIVSVHGGTITVDEAADGGARFEISGVGRGPGSIAESGR